MWATLFRPDANSPWGFVNLSDTEPTPAGAVGDFKIINIDDAKVGTLTTISPVDLAKQDLAQTAAQIRDANNLGPIDPTRAAQLQDAAVALILNDNIPVPDMK